MSWMNFIRDVPGTIQNGEICWDCDLRFPCRDDVVIHRRTPACRKGPYQCCICWEVIPQAPALRRHLLLIHKWVYPAGLRVPTTFQELSRVGATVTRGPLTMGHRRRMAHWCPDPRSGITVPERIPGTVPLTLPDSLDRPVRPPPPGFPSYPPRPSPLPESPERNKKVPDPYKHGKAPGSYRPREPEWSEPDSPEQTDEEEPHWLYDVFYSEDWEPDLVPVEELTEDWELNAFAFPTGSWEKEQNVEGAVGGTSEKEQNVAGAVGGSWETDWNVAGAVGGSWDMEQDKPRDSAGKRGAARNPRRNREPELDLTNNLSEYRGTVATGYHPNIIQEMIEDWEEQTAPWTDSPDDMDSCPSESDTIGEDWDQDLEEQDDSANEDHRPEESSGTSEDWEPELLWGPEILQDFSSEEESDAEYVLCPSERERPPPRRTLTWADVGRADPRPAQRNTGKTASNPVDHDQEDDSPYQTAEEE